MFFFFTRNNYKDKLEIFLPIGTEVKVHNSRLKFFLPRWWMRQIAESLANGSDQSQTSAFSSSKVIRQCSVHDFLAELKWIRLKTIVCPQQTSTSAERETIPLAPMNSRFKGIPGLKMEFQEDLTSRLFSSPEPKAHR